ncbi:hypothetical protein I5677_07320 [Mobilitalea sibirica]|uniref:Uncharacterized protein n=1 Tax=Mobilitalea sibirica TaxID=1462919 RepID=A0A8J7H233_9FIRM|nr:hypothetical protein [Mobilitalea sibirica]MBH1940693.1 hypothetical protein [Mobilitalea sibirica]
MKAALKYQILEFKKSTVIFYIIVLLVHVFFASIITVNDTTFRSDGGFEVATIIYLFISGLNSFKETFGMFIQNGVSRKTMFLSRTVSFLVISLIMVFMNFIFVRVLGLLNSSRFSVTDMYENIFEKRVDTINGLTRGFESLMLSLGVYLIAISLGYLITVAYYRMNKAGKLAVSVGVPVSVFVLLPMIDLTLDGRITSFMAKILTTIIGIRSGYPYYMYITSIIAFALFIMLSWFLMRKAVDKN